MNTKKPFLIRGVAYGLLLLVVMCVVWFVLNAYLYTCPKIQHFNETMERLATDESFKAEVLSLPQPDDHPDRWFEKNYIIVNTLDNTGGVFVDKWSDPQRIIVNQKLSTIPPSQRLFIRFFHKHRRWIFLDELADGEWHNIRLLSNSEYRKKWNDTHLAVSHGQLDRDWQDALIVVSIYIVAVFVVYVPAAILLRVVLKKKRCKVAEKCSEKVPAKES